MDARKLQGALQKFRKYIAETYENSVVAFMALGGPVLHFDDCTFADHALWGEFFRFAKVERQDVMTLAEFDPKAQQLIRDLRHFLLEAFGSLHGFFEVALGYAQHALSREDFVAAIEACRRPWPLPIDPEAAFGYLDLDHSGRLTREEMDEATADPHVRVAGRAKLRIPTMAQLQASLRKKYGSLVRAWKVAFNGTPRHVSAQLFLTSFKCDACNDVDYRGVDYRKFAAADFMVLDEWYEFMLKGEVIRGNKRNIDTIWWKLDQKHAGHLSDRTFSFRMQHYVYFGETAPVFRMLQSRGLQKVVTKADLDLPFRIRPKDVAVPFDTESEGNSWC